MRMCTMGVVFVIFALVVVCRASIWEGIINMEAPASTTVPTMEEITTARASTTVPTMEEITTANTMAPTMVSSSSARASNVSLEGWCSAPDAAYNPAILMPKGPQGPDGAILEYDLLSNSQVGIHYPGGHHLGSFVPATVYNPRNGEKQIYVPSAADQDPGTNQVTITASKYQDPWNFTQISSARLDTKGVWTTAQSPKTKNRGYLEVRSLMPANLNGGNNTGALAAIWMQASNRQEGHKTQIDIAKLKNGDPTVLLTHNPHNPIHLNTDMTKVPVIFGLEWNVQAGLGQIDLTWYVTSFDFPSKQWKTQNTTKSVLESEGDANDYFDLYNTFNGDGFYLLIGLAQGGDLTEVYHESDLLVDGPQHIVIESAKVYRLPEAVLKLTSSTQSTVDPVYMNNIDYLLKGYDILKGNPLPVDAILDQGYKELIFKAEYDGTTTADKRYHQPKGTSFVGCSGTCSFTFSSTQISGANSYQKSLGQRVDVEVGGEFEGWGAKFSASSGFKEVAERTSSHSSLFTESYATCCSYAAQVLSYTPPPLHEDFKAGVQTLTENYEEKVYQKFIERFGTHYIQWAQFGSLYGQQSEISKEAWALMEANKVDISFGASMSAYGATVSESLLTEDERKKAKEFSSETTNQKKFTIGVAPPKDGDLVEWSNAVIDNPAPMKIRLGSILELLDGQYGINVPDSIKENLKKALNDHCPKLSKLNDVTMCSAPGPDPPFPRPLPPQDGCYQEDTDYPGNDLNLGTGSNKDRRDSPAECQETCTQREGCKFFTWKEASKECWLKTIGKGNHEKGSISGPRICGNGERVCEGYGYDEASCTAIGCCQFYEGQCWSSVGKRHCFKSVPVWRPYKKYGDLPSDALLLGSYYKDGNLYVGRSRGEVGKINLEFGSSGRMKNLWTHDQWLSTDGEILCGNPNSVKWIPYRRGDSIPDGAFEGGWYHSDGKLFVGKTKDGEIGKINTDSGRLWNLWSSDQGESQDGFVLLNI